MTAVSVVAASFVTLAALALILTTATTAGADCTGGCGADLATAPKAVKKYVKKAWKAVRKCGKKARSVCPQQCAVPAAADFGLSAGCAARLECELGGMAANAFGGSWGGPDQLCAIAPAAICGNQRAKGAGKILVKRLKRRRTARMAKFSKDLAGCAGKVDKKTSCGGAEICNGTTTWLDLVYPVTIKKNGTQSVWFTAPEAGEGVGILTLSAETADWLTWSRESVVVEYAVDGSVIGTIVVYGGADPTDYRIQLGALEAGRHEIALKHKKKLSPAFDSPVVVTDFQAESVPESDSRHDALRYAPLLLGLDAKLNNPYDGHRGNTKSDVPLIMYVRTHPLSGKTKYEYVLVWSNEDGGTGYFPHVLLAQWGRPHDIETILEVEVSDAGQVLSMKYRIDENGTWPSFAGSFLGTHPILRTRSANGLIGDDGDSLLRFAIYPFSYQNDDGPRERALMLDPVAYAIGAKEMIREIKVEAVGDPATSKPSDLRNYLFVEMDVDVSVSGQVLRAVASVGGQIYMSDHGLPSNSGSLATRVSDGEHQVMIELPPGTTLAEVDQVGVQGVGLMSGTLYYLDAFMLGENFFPGDEHIVFEGAVTASGLSPIFWATP